MKARFGDRILARELRAKGHSFNEIMEKIPNLSKGTLNGWLKDITLTLEQKERLLLKIKAGSDRGRLKGSFTNHQKRVELTQKITYDDRLEVKKRISDKLFLAGIMLYWAEGDKTIERVGFTNSDPLMILLMMKWFREVCKVIETRFRIALTIMTLHDEKVSEQFWSVITKIPLNQFNKTRIKETPLRGKRNPSYRGTCRIVIADKNLFRKMLGWKLGILEHFKINAPVAQWIEQENSNL